MPNAGQILRSFGVDEEIPDAAGDALRVLVAFPPAGASQGIFSGLRRALGRPTQVIAPDILSRGSRPGEELPLTALVAKLASELHDRIGDRRYAVFGTSFGSIVAFEYVREIQARHLRPPELLIISGRQPPEDTDDFAECASWTDDEVWKHLLESQPDGTDLRTAPAELQEMAIEWFKRDMRLGAGYRYVPSEPLNVPIVVCHGTRDHGGRTPGVETAHEQITHDSLGYRRSFLLCFQAGLAHRRRARSPCRRTKIIAA
jgi:surfactin synthase thioesterase subunit